MRGEYHLQPIILNAGCGASGPERLPQLFGTWRHIRVDIDADARPDVVADITDLSPFSDDFADALWTSHCVEHLFQHQVGQALGEFLRVLKPDGFAVILVPDIQTIARYVAEDRMTEVLYDSPAGPITRHGVLYGHGLSVAEGNLHMAHKTAFTPSSIIACMRESGFADMAVRRRSNLELVAIGCKTPRSDGNHLQGLLEALAL